MVAVSTAEAKPVYRSPMSALTTATGMEKALWYLLVGTRGGENRVRMIRALSDRPKNANQLAEELDLDYNTVRYHLEKLVDHNVVEQSPDDYGKLYFLTDRFEHHRDRFETIVDKME